MMALFTASTKGSSICSLQSSPYHGRLHWHCPKEHIPCGMLSFLPQACGGQRSFKMIVCKADAILLQIMTVQLRMKLSGHVNSLTESS